MVSGSSDVAHDASASAVRVAAGILGSFVLLAGVDAVAIAASVPFPAGGGLLRLSDHVFDAAETLGVGAAMALAVGAFVRYARLPGWARDGVGILAASAVVYRVIGDYLANQAAHLLDGRFAWAIFVGFVGTLGATLATAPEVGGLWATRRVLRFVPPAVAVAALVADQIPLRDDYYGIHGLVAWGAALLAGPALAPAVERAGRALARGWAGRCVLAAGAAFALAGVVVPPPNAVRVALFHQPCAVAPWVLATTLWRPPALHAPAAPLRPAWMEDRSKGPPVPPTAPPLLPRDAVVVLMTIDALRADVVEDPANDARYPTLAALKREAVDFTHASTPGAQTAISLATLFSGRAFSELRWETYGYGKARFPYPAHDPSPRFPRILTDHGVETSADVGLAFLNGDFGVAPGFRYVKVTGAANVDDARGSHLVDVMVERLSHPTPGPRFLYTHVLDLHEPYGGTHATGSPRARYLQAVATADALVARLLGALRAGYGDRWALFVSADHGEAFGEHQTHQHSKTLYDELLHVPLFAMSPRFRARRVDARVGLVDLGPTLLDLFGAETPATFDGQSLVPFLAGGEAALTRPLIAESRLLRALTLPDGLKVIEDPRRETVEVYDLAADPGETRNLFDADPARADPALATLRGWFAAHALRDGGYTPPYKP